MYSYSIFLILLCSEAGMVLSSEERHPKTLKELGICPRIQGCDCERNLFSASRQMCEFVEVNPQECCSDDTNIKENQTTEFTTAPTITTNATPSINSFNRSTLREPRTRFGENVPLKPPNCGRSNAQFPRVVGGIAVKLGQFPWIAALGYRNKEQPTLPKWLCGGTLITNKHVLTAAHCVETSKELYIVRLGDLDLYSDDDGATPSDMLIKSATVHENYSSITFENDIAIITLSEEVDNPTVWPICLPTDEPLRSKGFVGYTPFVAGWGKTRFKGPSSSALLTTQLPVVDNERCARAYKEFKRVNVDNRILCAGLEGTRDACNGDSGGPLMFPVQSEGFFFYIIGVVSLGFRCAEAGYPGLYTRVTDFVDWIQGKLES